MNQTVREIDGVRYAMFSLFGGCVELLVDAQGGMSSRHWDGSISRWRPGRGLWSTEPVLGQDADAEHAAKDLAAFRKRHVVKTLRAMVGRRVRIGGSERTIASVEIDPNFEGYSVTCADGAAFDNFDMQPMREV